MLVLISLLGTRLLALGRFLLLLLNWLLVLTFTLLALLEDNHATHLQLHQKLLNLAKVTLVTALLSLRYLVQNLLVVGSLLREVHSIRVRHRHTVVCILTLNADQAVRRVLTVLLQLLGPHSLYRHWLTLRLIHMILLLLLLIVKHLLWLLVQASLRVGRGHLPPLILNIAGLLTLLLQELNRLTHNLWHWSRLIHTIN